MKIAFFDTKPYDIHWFDGICREHGHEVKFFDYKLSEDTAILARGYDAVCIFVNDTANSAVIDILANNGVKLIALRCSGYNNIDFSAAYGKIHVVRVPSYSPSAISEYAAALLLAVNRKIPRAVGRTRNGNFNINGLIGVNLSGRTAGIIGTGKIGRLFAGICRGFNMKVIAYDPYPDVSSGIEYTTLDRLISSSDVISLHCPLTSDTHHIINKQRIQRMKDGVYIINTSRGALIDTTALIDGLKMKKIAGAGLDVYEEEEKYFFEDFSEEVITDDELMLLLSFPNVIVSSHQAFFTEEAMKQIAEVTVSNFDAFENGFKLVNELCYDCYSDKNKEKESITK